MISEQDRGLAYGDGLFETIAAIRGQLHNWELHWLRLEKGAQRLLLDLPEEALLLEQINSRLSEYSDLFENNYVVKLILTRGVGGRGYQLPPMQQCHLVIAVHDWPERPDKDYHQGIRALLCHSCLAPQPALAGIKHLNRLEQVLARREIDDKQFQEGILLNCNVDNTEVHGTGTPNLPFRPEARVIEASSSNLFFVKHQQLCTPLIDTCGVEGTIRQQILLLAEQWHIPFKQAHYGINDLLQATEIFICNSVFGIVALNSLYIEAGHDWEFAPETYQSSDKLLATRFAVVINRALHRPERLLL